MNRTTGNSRLWERWKGAEQLALMATFEDSTSCTRVKGFCQVLMRDLGEGCKVSQHVWVFSTFRMAELQAIAADEAAAADLVIIAARQTQGLPEEVKSWIENWLQRKGERKTVLVALLNRVYDGSAHPVRAYLQEIAKRAELELLVDLGEG